MKLVLKGEARVQAEFGLDWPDLKGEMYNVYERDELASLDGVDDPSGYFMEYFWPSRYGALGESIRASVFDGFMSFEYDVEEGRLYTLTTYEVSRVLREEELQILIDYTQGQWSDGIGEGFEQFPVNGRYYISAWAGPEQEVTAYYEDVV